MNIAHKILALTGLTIALALPANAGAIYNINFNGSVVDLSGFIETDAVGIFSPTDFDSQITNYSIFGSWNGFAPFEFTKANSTWGGSFVGAGANVSISILASAITLSAPLGYDYDGGNIFLIADNPAPDGIIQNLRIAQDHLGFRSDPDTMVFETVSPTFTLATASVPEPTSLSLLAAGLGLIAFRVRRRRVLIGH